MQKGLLHFLSHILYTILLQPGESISATWKHSVSSPWLFRTLSSCPLPDILGSFSLCFWLRANSGEGHLQVLQDPRS